MEEGRKGGEGDHEEFTMMMHGERLGLKRVVACLGAGLRAAPHEHSFVYILCLCLVVCV